jgi:hypothetical protein
MKTKLIALLSLSLAACATPPPSVTTLINCPPPPIEALAPADPLPDVPPMRADAQDAIAVMSRALASDAEQYEILAGRHASVVAWGREHCRW